MEGILYGRCAETDRKVVGPFSSIEYTQKCMDRVTWDEDLYMAAGSFEREASKLGPVFENDVGWTVGVQRVVNEYGVPDEYFLFVESPDGDGSAGSALIGVDANGVWMKRSSAEVKAVRVMAQIAAGDVDATEVVA